MILDQLLPVKCKKMIICNNLRAQDEQEWRAKLSKEKSVKGYRERTAGDNPKLRRAGRSKNVEFIGVP
jgi:hypothetical protein